jgi:GntR family transcriptional regulator
MLLHTDSDIPLFVQLSEGIEDAILSGAFPEESQIPSITEFSATCQINPATALKGINLLVEEDVLYKKRGVGMFVRAGATEKLQKKRRQNFCRDYADAMITEAKRLHIKKEELLTLIERRFDDERN